MSAVAVSSSAKEAPSSESFELTDAQKALIRKSFDRLAPAADLVATLFFMRLFDVKPKLRDQFPGPIKPQAKLLANTLRIAVLSLNSQHSFKPTLRLLGASLRQNGIEARAYSTMQKALIWSFDKSLEKEFTYATKRAWTVFLSQMTSVMALP